MNRYRCDTCGCYLDPGEGRTCDECQRQERERSSRARIAQTVIMSDAPQYEFDFDEYGGLII